jgi:hypothetical protein
MYAYTIKKEEEAAHFSQPPYTGLFSTDQEQKQIDAWKTNPDEKSKTIFNGLKGIQFEDGVTISKVRYIWNKGDNKTVAFELKGRDYPSYGLDAFISVDKNQLNTRPQMPIQKDIDLIKTATGITGGRRKTRKHKHKRKSRRKH